MKIALAFAALLVGLPLDAFAQDLWVGSWATSQQIPEDRNALPAGALDHATLRQIVHLSLGGQRLRLRLSNAFGTAPLHIAAAHIAAPVSPSRAAIVPASDTALAFNGQGDITIPAGAEYLSDPVVFAAAPASDIAITLTFDAGPSQQTSHPGSRATSYLAQGADASAADLPGAKKIEHWFFIAGIDVETKGAAIVALGDSITDGRGSTTNGNDRWTDDLAARVPGLGVLNHGIGGGRVLQDSLGPNALARFDRDVIAQAGARYLIVFEGINDIGTFDSGGDPDGTPSPQAHAALVRDLTGAYAQMIARAHAAGLAVYGATITPFMDCGPYHPKPVSEADRIAVNRWIRTPGHFDGVVDFDAAVRDPVQPDHLAAAYDSGDHLHPSPAGYRAMAAAVPLKLFGR